MSCQHVWHSHYQHWGASYYVTSIPLFSQHRCCILICGIHCANSKSKCLLPFQLLWLCGAVGGCQCEHRGDGPHVGTGHSGPHQPRPGQLGLHHVQHGSVDTGILHISLWIALKNSSSLTPTMWIFLYWYGRVMLFMIIIISVHLRLHKCWILIVHFDTFQLNFFSLFACLKRSIICFKRLAIWFTFMWYAFSR